MLLTMVKFCSVTVHSRVVVIVVSATSSWFRVCCVSAWQSRLGAPSNISTLTEHSRLNAAVYAAAAAVIRGAGHLSW